MLVITRKIGGVIHIETSDGPIEVMLVKVHGLQARIGIAAPESVVISRKEIMNNGNREVRDANNKMVRNFINSNSGNTLD